MQPTRIFPGYLSAFPKRSKTFEFGRPVIAGVMRAAPAGPGDTVVCPTSIRVAIRVAPGTTQFGRMHVRLRDDSAPREDPKA